MTQPQLKTAVAFRGVAYLILAAVGIQALLDLVSSALPLLPDLVAWRLKAEGLAAAAWSTPALVILLMCFLAFASEDRKVLQVLTVISALGALSLIVTACLFALDAIQMYKSIPPADNKAYAIAAAYAMAKLGIGTLSLGLLAWTSARAAKSLRRSSASQSARQGIMVGTPATPAT